LCNADANRQFVLLPDLSSTVQSWNKQWLLMLAWLVTSVVTILVIAPLAAFHHWSLVSMGAIVTAAFSTVGIVQYGLKSTCRPEDGE
jgi:O-antigen/teichoic acid export membrane protein